MKYNFKYYARFSIWNIFAHRFQLKANAINWMSLILRKMWTDIYIYVYFFMQFHFAASHSRIHVVCWTFNASTDCEIEWHFIEHARIQTCHCFEKECRALVQPMTVIVMRIISRIIIPTRIIETQCFIGILSSLFIVRKLWEIK